MSAQRYLRAVTAAIRRLDVPAIQKAAKLLADKIAAGKSIFAFGASHSFVLVEEMVYRTGGLMLINPIYPHGMHLGVRPLPLTSRLERLVGLGSELLAHSPARAGDVLILISTSGRNPVTIDMAIAARARRISTIGIVSRQYTQRVSSRHPSGKKLADLCDMVLDNGAPYGDAAIPLAGFPDRVGPLSTVSGCALVNALVCETAQQLLQRGVTPPVFVSANTDEGDAHNARLLAAYRRRIHYM